MQYPVPVPNCIRAYWIIMLCGGDFPIFRMRQEDLDISRFHLRGFANVFWHSFMALLVPLAATLLDSNTCNESASCCPSRLELELPFWESPFVRAFTPIFPQLIVVQRARLDPVTMQRITYLPQRTDHFGSNIECVWPSRCAKQSAAVILSARRLLRSLACHAAQCRPQRPEALIILRCTDPSGTTHPHRGMCLRTGDADLARLRVAFAAVNVTTVVATHFSRISLLEQMRAVARASVVLFSHGSSHANLVATSPGTVFVELTPYVHPDSVAVSCTLNGQLQATAQSGAAGARAGISVDAGRAQSQSLARMFSAARLPVHHRAVPAYPGGSRQWGCLPMEALVQIATEALKQGSSWAMPPPGAMEPPGPGKESNPWHWHP